MRIQVMSDIHFEFMLDMGESFFQSLDPSGVDVLVLPGDIATLRQSTFGGTASGPHLLEPVLRRFCSMYPHVVYVCGNHEFYGTNRMTIVDMLTALGRDLPNFHWLENRAVVIDGQRFLGCTLWFPDDPENRRYARNITDFHVIKGFSAWVYNINKDSVQFLTENIQPGDVVVTHHLPDARAVHLKYRGSQLNRFFLCQMPHEVLSRPRYWFFGHTHESCAFTIGDCAFRCNPFGYARVELNEKFADKLIVGGTDKMQCPICFFDFEVASDALVVQGEIECPGCGQTAATV